MADLRDASFVAEGVNRTEYNNEYAQLASDRRRFFHSAGLGEMAIYSASDVLFFKCSGVSYV